YFVNLLFTLLPNPLHRPLFFFEVIFHTRKSLYNRLYLHTERIAGEEIIEHVHLITFILLRGHEHLFLLLRYCQVEIEMPTTLLWQVPAPPPATAWSPALAYASFLR